MCRILPQKLWENPRALKAPRISHDAQLRQQMSSEDFKVMDESSMLLGASMLSEAGAPPGAAAAVNPELSSSEPS